MRRCRRYLLNRPFMVGMAALTAVLSISPRGAVAMPSESVGVATSAPSVREAQVERIMQALTAPRARVHLLAAGITPGELRLQLARLDDDELASVAERTEVIAAGGIVELVIGLLVVAILVVILIYLLSDKEIKVDVKDKD